MTGRAHWNSGHIVVELQGNYSDLCITLDGLGVATVEKGEQREMIAEQRTPKNLSTKRVLANPTPRP